MPGRLRRASVSQEHATDEGPFVSFTDLFIGILFLFLILVAALMLMHQEAVQKALADALAYQAQIRQLQAKIDAAAKLDAERPPFRLAIVYNSYQRPAGETDWTFSRTVQIYRAPNDLCLENVLLRNNLNVAWKPLVKAESIPTAAKQDYVRGATPCTLSASGEHWNSESETGGLKRTSANLYGGSTVLHKKDAQVTIELQYRVLGIFDDYYR
jgi:hypothetical protein